MTNILKKNRISNRVRKKIRAVSNGKPRLSVFRSNKNIHAQIIDDVNGVTIASASTIDKEIKGKLKVTSNTEAAKQVGALIAKRATEKKVSEVVFDRGGNAYHGRIKALADSAREAGLKF
ncbi:MAG: 50S ribosomal protein L18 [Rickettsiales bacterium]|nr:50S ribosomal protein L18 [Rickettsiales bacterium]